jgi:hypothetical protein
VEIPGVSRVGISDCCGNAFAYKVAVSRSQGSKVSINIPKLRDFETLKLSNF